MYTFAKVLPCWSFVLYGNQSIPCRDKTGFPVGEPHALPLICPHGTLIDTTVTYQYK